MVLSVCMALALYLRSVYNNGSICLHGFGRLSEVSIKQWFYIPLAAVNYTLTSIEPHEPN